MPAVAFNPLAAVIVHSQVPVNPATFQMLREEAALLIHGCRRSATRQEWRRYNRHGKLIVFVRHSPLLTYAVTATALDPTGENLGNYHPGRCLSDRTLAFVNGGTVPYQFEAAVEGVMPGKFILRDPVQDPGAGDATEVSFTVEHAFVDLDVDDYPGGSVATPGTPESFVTLPEQTAASLTTEALDALAGALFLDVHPFGSSLLSLTLYDGDPAGAGVAVSDPLILSEWLLVDEPDIPSRTRCRNHALLEFLDASGLDRTVTHLQWSRNGIPIARKALAAPVVIPGYYGLRIPVGAIGLQLTWLTDGDMASSAHSLPAQVAFAYLFGTEGLAPSQTGLYVNFYDGDPYTTGNLVADTDLTISRDAAGWSVSGHVVSSADTLAGTDAAPGGGWSIPYVVVGIDGGGNTWWIVRQFSPPLSIAPGGSVALSAGDLTATCA